MNSSNPHLLKPALAGTAGVSPALVECHIVRIVRFSRILSESAARGGRDTRDPSKSGPVTLSSFILFQYCQFTFTNPVPLVGTV
jgi:hypothetical protein